MTEHESNGDKGYSPKRRRLLQGIGAMGALGAFGAGQVSARGPGGGGPPGQSCEDCPDGKEFIAKYEFECVDWDEDDNCIEWDFVFEKGDDIVDITVIEEKDDDPSEPISIEFEAEGYVIQHVCVYGGRDNDEKTDEDGLDEFKTDLENPGGQQAAISNVVFCGEETTEVEFPETVSVAYEDLPPGAGNDYDYNDWVVDIEATMIGTQSSDVSIESIEMDLNPMAAGGADDHDWYIVPKEDLGENIEYELEWFDEDGDSEGTESGEIDGRDLGDVTDEFPIDDPVDELDLDDGGIHVFDSTDVFASGEIVNSEAGDSCTPPNQTAHLTLTLDDPWTVDPDELELIGDHGEGLFINPVKVSQNTGAGRNEYPVAVGDNRLLAVPTDWAWPNEAIHIGEAYDLVDEETPPNFDDDWQDGDYDEDLVFDACRD